MHGRDAPPRAHIRRLPSLPRLGQLSQADTPMSEQPCKEVEHHRNRIAWRKAQLRCQTYFTLNQTCTQGQIWTVHRP